MKTSFSPKLVSVIAALSIAFFSCSKDSLTVPAATSGNPAGTPDASSLGTINDLGFTSSGTKVMYTSFVIQDYTVQGSQDYTVQGSESTSGGGGAVLVLSFYSTDDGVVPDGTYTLATPGTQEPFTFDFTSLSAPLDPASTSNVDLQVLSGTVVVTRNDYGYTFSTSLILTTGSTFNGYSSGKMQYIDSDVTGKKK
jgi:hypothetical protein